MGIIVRSIFCIGILTAVSPLNEARVDRATISETAAPLMAAPVLLGQAAQLCAQNPALCHDRASQLAAPTNAATQATSGKPRGG